MKNHLGTNISNVEFKGFEINFLKFNSKVKIKTKIKTKTKNFSLGLKVLIDGNIPRSAGLSSSSALVVCAALTISIANGISINKVFFSFTFRFDLTQKCFSFRMN